jgi:hypothetical protein
MKRRSVRLLTVAAAASTAAGAALAVPGAAGAATGHRLAEHVLLLSVDGLHAADLATYVRNHPGSALAQVVSHGLDYTNALTPFPSDSFPGMVGQVTGGNPKTTGVYYDVSYNRALLPPGTTDCARATPGTAVHYEETVDRDPTRLDAGQGLSGLPGSILGMTGRPQTLLNPAALPVDPATCQPVLPHGYLKANTIFEVAKAAGLGTAWSDKHAAYDILNGPSGTGIDDLFTPEINSNADAAGNDWTAVNAYTQQYDHYRTEAVLNEITGHDHSGTRNVRTPAIYGMNFQSVSTAQKLPLSGGRPGGYDPAGTVPSPVLSSALTFVDHEVGSMLAALQASGERNNTVLVLSAKHGQSPTDTAALTRVDDGGVLDALNAAWAATRPGATLVAGSTDDDGMLLWLNDRSVAATGFAKAFLAGYDGTGTTTDGKAKATSYAGTPKAYHAAGLSTIYAGADAAAFMGVPASDTRVPDLIGIAQHGTVFTGGTKKIAEHGGNDLQDRNVPLVVAAPQLTGRMIGSSVETTQIAPTILRILGLDPQALSAVRAEGTQVLPLG